MWTTKIGKEAEAKVARYLKDAGYKILGQNWRTKVCEIDIVAQKSSVVYFVEVKFRSRNGQGDGFDYITPGKLKQMTFAARVWNQQNGWEGDWRLLAAAVSNKDIEVIELS